MGVTNVLEQLPAGGRVAVIRLRSLGDCVLTTPALAILKQLRPDLRVVVVVEDRFRAIFEDNPDVDGIVPPTAAAAGRIRPQLCLNLHGGSRSTWMTAVSGARYRAGFGHFRGQMVYNVRIPRAQQILGIDRKVHTAEHLASAVFHLGAPLTEIPRAKLIAPARGSGCVVIHPAAAAPAKTWHADGFLTVARQLARSDVVFIGGESDDLSPFSEFRTMRGAPLAELKSLLGSASLFIGNDSGPAHIAAAFGVPSVVIFGSSDPAIWGPWRTPAEVVTAPGGIASVTAERVLEALARLRVHA